MYIGHKREDGGEQPLKAHLDGVALLAATFAEGFGASKHAERAGQLHDAGKYSRAGQRRMRDPGHTAKVDHATAGAQIAWRRLKDGVAGCAIAGHHGGMPDFGRPRAAAEGDGTLLGRVHKELTGDYNYSAFFEENAPAEGRLEPGWLNPRNAYEMQFYTRMLFSCLVDADFLDTEAFMRGGPAPRGGGEPPGALLARLERHVQGWLDAPRSELDARRNAILLDCLRAAERPMGLYTLTVPTGGGKTVSSLAFALRHAVRHGLRRVIYVIPYTSIIEQTAGVFREILGPENVLEHHSAATGLAAEDMEEPAVMRQLLAAENWDAPVVVTTSVQFFESLHANRPRSARKLHNIAESVIIFDEAQMLPVPYLRACVNAIGELVRHYRVTAVLCTATQPSLNGLFADYDPSLRPEEICRDADRMRDFFRRVRFEIAGEQTEEALADCLRGRTQALCIVNTRKRARTIYELIRGEGSYHLTTRMTPAHRVRTLQEIRDRLRDGEPCRVISTSLMEAGVDVDFPEVWREMAGLDSILQAAGRCNRNAKNDPEASIVHVFACPGGVPKSMRQNAEAASLALEAGCAIDDPRTVARYFDRLLGMVGEGTDANGILRMCGDLEFSAVAKAFHLIEDVTFSVFIPDGENEAELDALRAGRYDRALLRRLGQNAVNVQSWDWKALTEGGRVDVVGDGMGILRDPADYDRTCGLTIDSEPGRGFFM